MPRTPTHVISAILNIGQDVEEDWPLFLRDHRGEDHVVMRHVSRVTPWSRVRLRSRVTCQVILTPGDLVWYESARVVHGRQFPLRGGSFDNLFLHFKPLVWYR